jgi:uncharacterized membrane protein
MATTDSAYRLSWSKMLWDIVPALAILAGIAAFITSLFTAADFGRLAAAEGRTLPPRLSGAVLDAALDRLPWAGVCLFALTALALRFRSALQSVFSRIAAGGRSLPAEVRRDLLSASPDLPRRLEWMVLAVVFIAAAIVRLAFVSRPLEPVETHTWSLVTTQSVFWTMTHYGSFDNHVLHSILAHLSTALFGNHVWALRLPALLAGLVSIPLAWACARSLGGAWAGLWAATGLAILPCFVGDSIHARGGALLGLALLFCLWAALKLAADARRAECWAWFILCAAAGCYTTPLMLLPLLALALWLVLAWTTAAGLPALRRGVPALFTAAAAIVLLAALAYLPILLYSGPHALFAAWSATAAPLPVFAADLWTRYTAGLPLPVIAVFAAALAAALFQRRPAASAVFGVTAALFALAPSVRPYPDVFTCLLLALVVFSGAGVAVLFRRLPARPLLPALLLMALALSAVWSLVNAGAAPRSG